MLALVAIGSKIDRFCRDANCGFRLYQAGQIPVFGAVAGDTMAENLHPLGQIYYGFSTTVCTPNSLSQEVGLGLARVGSIAGHSSGDIFCAFSTTNRRPREAEGRGDRLQLGDQLSRPVLIAECRRMAAQGTRLRVDELILLLDTDRELPAKVEIGH